MDYNCEPDETDNLWSIDSRQEMEYRLNSLQSLICDLLKTNQELREALLDARISVQGSEETQSVRGRGDRTSIGPNGGKILFARSLTG